MPGWVGGAVKRKRKRYNLPLTVCAATTTRAAFPDTQLAFYGLLVIESKNRLGCRQIPRVLSSALCVTCVCLPIAAGCLGACAVSTSFFRSVAQSGGKMVSVCLDTSFIRRHPSQSSAWGLDPGLIIRGLRVLGPFLAG